MELKANVQKRRQDRIKELQSRSMHAPSAEAFGRDGPNQNRRQMKEAVDTIYGGGPKERDPNGYGPPLWIRGPMDPDHAGDPEEAWKQREKELLRWYAEGGSSSGSGPADREDWEHRRSGSSFGGGPARRLFFSKTLIALILFAGTWMMFRMDTPWAQEGKRYIRAALTRDMDFGAVAAWYSQTFSGSPSLLPAFGNKQEAAKVHAPVASTRFVQPVKGKAKEAFSASKQGLWLVTKKDAQVAAADDGRIEFTGDTAETGYTLVIQHADGYRITYGGLQAGKWEAGDWVKAGEIIGTAAEESGQGAVFLAVMKDQRYVNPLDVIPFD